MTDGSGGPLDVQVDAGTPPPTFRVVRVGDGTTALSTTSSAVFIEELLEKQL